MTRRIGVGGMSKNEGSEHQSERRHGDEKNLLAC